MIGSLYEISTHGILTVFIAFWSIEFPAMLYTKRYFYMAIDDWSGVFVAHSLPEALVFVEFFNSSIMLEWRSYWIYLVLGIIVLILNIMASLYVEELPPYAAFNWKDDLKKAIPFTVAVFLIQTFSYFVTYKVKVFQ